MANYVSNSQINLSVNAKQAGIVLDSMKQKAEGLRKSIDRAADAGDGKKVKKLTQELRQVEGVIRQSTTETVALENTLRRLDKASPKELKKALSSLQRQLNSMERGSAAWDAHVEKIRRVKDELSRLNIAMNTQKTTWEKFNGWLNDTQTFLAGAAAAVTGLIIAGKSAVQKFADMDQEMANVAKFTGMSADEIDRLNESFLSIDTRTTREDLNKLAQEAGRLGKTSQTDVLGFVKAADKINVALDDLGEGATLTLSKLTGIFGDEERYGTEQSLMKVGSVINELSQNCSASAPYIANFTERLGGVGAQAGMTIQQIMGFAAVLDSNSQKVEASATALSQVIVRLYQDPAKYARVAGLDVQKFSDLMRKDANSALLLFLETLNKAGGMDKLSPMFKDMGETGARAIAALSTLATNIQAVKDQQGVANEAFREGISIQKEFDVQNNTVQAGMDKAGKKISEIAIELGEKLQPVMSHVYSSSSIMLRALSTMVTFMIRNSGAIMGLVAALVAYKVAAMTAASWTKILAGAQSAWGVITATLEPLTKGLAAATYLLTGNLTRARVAWRAMTMAMSSNAIGLITAAVAALTVAVYNLTKKTDEYADSAKKIIEDTKGITEATVKENRELDTLFGKLKGASKGSKDYQDAKKKIIDQYGKYLSGLIDEKGEIIDLSKAYDILSESIRRSARERGLATAKENLETAFAEQSSKDLTQLQKSLESYGASVQEAAMLSQAVSEAVVSGKAVPAQAAARIRQLGASNPVMDDQGKRLHAGQRVAAGMGLALHIAENPEKILDRLSKSVGDFDRSIKTIEGMQKGTSKAPGVSDDDLRRTIADLDKVIEDGKGTVRFPNAYVNKKLRVDEMANVDELNRQRAAASLLGKSGNKTSLLGANSQGGSLLNYSPELSKTPTGVPYRMQPFADLTINADTAKRMREVIARELNVRGADLYKSPEPEKNKDGGDSGSSDFDPDKAKKEREEAFRKALKEIENAREDAVEKATAENAAGLTDYLTYMGAKHEAQLKFYDDSKAAYKSWKMTELDGYSKLLRDRAQEERSWKSRTSANSIEEVKREQRREEIELKLHYAAKGKLSESEEQELQDQLFDIRLKAMQRELEITNKGAQDYAAKKEAIEQALNENLLQKRQRLAQMAAQFEQEYAKKTAEEKLRIELKGLDELLKTGTISREQFDSMSSQAKKKYLPGSPKNDRHNPQKDYAEQKGFLDSMYADGLISEEEYSSRLKAIEADLRHSVMEGLAGCKSEWVSTLTSMYQAWADFADALKDPEGNPFNALAAGISATAAVMSAVMQSVSQMTSAEVEIQTQAIEKRYDREAAFAEGNSYLQTKLEKKKEKEIAKMKSDAAKKNFAMQVAMTVATTAANAVEAYGAALKVGGPLGLALAPVAAALALAQGTVQIAALKKQQQVAESSGYAEGGFTRKGRKDEPAGIVHAGEWVASQKLVNNPVSRQVIDVLEYAQRNNTVASLSWDDVSRSVSAPVAMSYASRPEQPAVVQVQQSSPAFDPAPLNQAVSRLVERLEQPIVAHNTVEGPLGYKQAQDEYLRLMSNKSR